MSNSLKDILDSNKFSEPDEIRVIKNFIFENYQSQSNIKVGTDYIAINVSSAALAGTLRMRLGELQKLCDTKKKLIIKIG